MNSKVLITPSAEADLDAVFSWYEDKRKGLGFDFLLQIDAGFHFIERSPMVSPQEYKETRKYFIKRFPYKIIYLVEDNRIVILAVLHGKRSPELLKTRIDEA